MNYTLEITHDPYPDDPRKEFDQASHFVCFHRRYNLGDDHGYKSEDFDDWGGLEKQLAKDGAAVALPIYLYDHSGLTLSTAPFRCPWDSGQVGFAYMTEKDILDNFMEKRLTRDLEKRAEDLIRGEVEEYSSYLEGDVWCYDIKDEYGNVVDSCCGFYGYKYAEECGKEALSTYNTLTASTTEREDAVGQFGADPGMPDPGLTEVELFDEEEET